MSAFETKSISIEMEELGTMVAVAAQELGLANEVQIKQWYDNMIRSIMHQFTTYIAGGAPATVTISVKVPATWWQHAKRAFSDNAIFQSATPWGRQFGHWLGARVETKPYWGRKDVNRNICPHFKAPAHSRKHLDFLVSDTVLPE